MGGSLDPPSTASFTFASSKSIVYPTSAAYRLNRSNGALDIKRGRGVVIQGGGGTLPNSAEL